MNESSRGDETVTRRTRDSKAVLPRKKLHRSAATARSRESRFSPGVTRWSLQEGNDAWTPPPSVWLRARRGFHPGHHPQPPSKVRPYMRAPAAPPLRSSKAHPHAAHAAMTTSPSAPEPRASSSRHQGRRLASRHSGDHPRHEL